MGKWEDFCKKQNTMKQRSLGHVKRENRPSEERMAWDISTLEAVRETNVCQNLPRPQRPRSLSLELIEHDQAAVHDRVLASPIDQVNNDSRNPDVIEIQNVDECIEDALGSITFWEGSPALQEFPEELMLQLRTYCHEKQTAELTWARNYDGCQSVIFGRSDEEIQFLDFKTEKKLLAARYRFGKKQLVVVKATHPCEVDAFNFGRAAIILFTTGVKFEHFCEPKYAKYRKNGWRIWTPRGQWVSLDVVKLIPFASRVLRDSDESSSAAEDDSDVESEVDEHRQKRPLEEETRLISRSHKRLHGSPTSIGTAQGEPLLPRVDKGKARVAAITRSAALRLGPPNSSSEDNLHTRSSLRLRGEEYIVSETNHSTSGESDPKTAISLNARNPLPLPAPTAPTSVDVTTITFLFRNSSDDLSPRRRSLAQCSSAGRLLAHARAAGIANKVSMMLMVTVGQDAQRTIVCGDDEDYDELVQEAKDKAGVEAGEVLVTIMPGEN